jgi:hypothetical protein
MKHTRDVRNVGQNEIYRVEAIVGKGYGSACDTDRDCSA